MVHAVPIWSTVRKILTQQNQSTRRSTTSPTATKFSPCTSVFAHRSYPYFDVVAVGLEWSNEPESYASGSVATGRVALVGQVKCDDPD